VCACGERRRRARGQEGEAAARARRYDSRRLGRRESTVEQARRGADLMRDACQCVSDVRGLTL
jgi:hypothetical protein